MNISIIVAAGKGERLSSVLNKKKQFHVIANNEEMFLFSLKTFIDYGIETNILVIPQDDLSLVKQILEREGIIDKVEIVFGGDSRQESVHKALRYIEINYPSLNKVASKVYVHDADRPLLTLKLLKRLDDAYGKNYAVIPYLNITDSVYDTKEGKYVERKNLRLVQTPQLFNLDLLIHAYIKNRYSLSSFTDEGSVVKTIYDNIDYIEGDPCNIKVTDKNSLDLVIIYLKDKKL